MKKLFVSITKLDLETPSHGVNSMRFATKQITLKEKHLTCSGTCVLKIKYTFQRKISQYLCSSIRRRDLNFI